MLSSFFGPFVVLLLIRYFGNWVGQLRSEEEREEKSISHSQLPSAVCPHIPTLFFATHKRMLEIIAPVLYKRVDTKSVEHRRRSVAPCAEGSARRRGGGPARSRGPGLNLPASAGRDEPAVHFPCGMPRAKLIVKEPRGRKADSPTCK